MKNEILKKVLRLARRGSSNVNFRECANERDRMECVTDPYHRETVGKLRDEMWAGVTLELDALIEVINSFSEPQANDQE